MKQDSIGLFYGSSTCYTEIAAEKIQQQFTTNSVKLFNIAVTPVAQISEYQKLIFGIPTWDYGEPQEDWDNIWDDLNEINLSNSTIGLFGLGDQVGYSDWFLDAMGYLHDKVLTKGAKVIGYWPTHDYKFTASQALTKNKDYFVGLALDDENEPQKTNHRIAQWCNQLKQHFYI